MFLIIKNLLSLQIVVESGFCEFVVKKDGCNHAFAGRSESDPTFLRMFACCQNFVYFKLSHIFALN